MLVRKLIMLKRKKVKNFFTKRHNLKYKPRIKSRSFNRLHGGPQRKGTVTRVTIMTPKKPNSAIRHIAKVAVYKSNGRALCRIPGIGSLPTKFNRVLFRGGRANDLPTVRLTLIRGVFDFSPLYSKKRRRSVYGVPRPESLIKHVRRCYRHLQL